MQPTNAKKPCTAASKKEKHKSNPSKDPQSVAAKVCFKPKLYHVLIEIQANLKYLVLIECLFVSQNRRERISERLKILQELVPNGSKVDFQISPKCYVAFFALL